MTNEETAYKVLKERLGTVSDLSSANKLLLWDRQTYMPEGGFAGRAEEMATLSRLAHETLVDVETSKLLDSSGVPDPSSERGALIRRALYEYERAAKLPTKLVEEITRTTTLAEKAWVEAREKSDWAIFAPHFKKILLLQREVAECFGYEDHPYDALLGSYEPGVTKAQLDEMFQEIKKGIVPLAKVIIEQSINEEDRTLPLYGVFDEAQQEGFVRRIVSDFGYDWKRGRQDRSLHPFTLGVGPGDVRITTRFHKAWLAPALFGTMHEAGHALYGQGINPAYARTPLYTSASLGIDESQSRLWENLIGRSDLFWSHYYPQLRERFPKNLSKIDLETFVRAINAVKPSKIRVEADEVTYNLHILLRFELEVDLLEDNLSVMDLPAAWNAKMKEYLLTTPENDAEGVLQDIHWSNGAFAYFPTYAIGNVLSVQFFSEAVETHPEIPAEIRQGRFFALQAWLRENIYRHGARYYPNELLKRVTGRRLDTAPYLRYLKSKFGELYDLG
jgi:carboxypeptidase Taq